jgi:hypothetical protein
LDAAISVDVPLGFGSGAGSDGGSEREEAEDKAEKNRRKRRIKRRIGRSLEARGGFVFVEKKLTEEQRVWERSKEKNRRSRRRI